MAAGSCAGVGEAGGFEWAQPERNTADETRSSVAVRRRGFALRHELIVAFLRMGLRRSLSNAPRAKPRRPSRRRPGWDARFLTRRQPYRGRLPLALAARPLPLPSPAIPS